MQRLGMRTVLVSSVVILSTPADTSALHGQKRSRPCKWPILKSLQTPAVFAGETPAA
jgi:hypothetical protein